MRRLDELINSGQTLTRREVAAAGRFLSSRCEVLSSGWLRRTPSR